MYITFRILEEENKIAIYFGRTNRRLSGTSEPGVSLFLTPTGKLGRLEIYPATEILGIKDLKKASLGQFVGLAEAADLMQVKKPNFIRDFIKTGKFPKPLTELASGKIWDRQEVEDFKKKYRLSKTKRFFKKIKSLRDIPSSK